MDQITQIKQQLDIATVIGSYVQLKKSGKNYKGVCPFHSENSPSFMVSSELQMYKCFGCGEAGDVIQFIQKIDGVDFPTALEKLAEQAGIKLEKTTFDPDAKLKKQIFWLNEQSARFYHQILVSHPAGKAGLDYLLKVRQLSQRTIDSFLIGFAPDNQDTLFKFFTSKHIESDLIYKSGLTIKKDEGGYMDKFRGRIMFPLTGVDGKFLGFTGRTIFDRNPKYLNSPETPVFHKSSFIFGLDKAKVFIKKQGAILVEGQMDVISAHEVDISNVVAASGTSLTTPQLKLISRYTNDLVFCFDTDVAGVGAAFRGIELAENMGFNIKVAIIPAGFKDLDEVIKQSIDTAKDIFSNAVPAYDFLLHSIIKKQNKNSPEGKKKIMDEVVPWFARIKNPVLIDHYSKQLSKELDISEETVAVSLKSGKSTEISTFSPTKTTNYTQMSQQSLESYIITLLLKGGLDFIQSKLYKVDLQAYSDENLRQLLENLRNYINEGTNNGHISNFDPSVFKKTLNSEQAALFDDLYLYEVDEEILSDSYHLDRELDTVLFRLQGASARRRMQELSQLMKDAEKSNDVEAIKKLTTEFEQLKSLLLSK